MRPQACRTIWVVDYVTSEYKTRAADKLRFDGQLHVLRSEAACQQGTELMTAPVGNRTAWFNLGLKRTTWNDTWTAGVQPYEHLILLMLGAWQKSHPCSAERKGPDGMFLRPK